ncbi:protein MICRORCHIDIA 6-like isoform X4 [Populus alba x Populus x berolinensis]|uniref:MORC family CW-type zinc finger protein 3-like isoform X3 n=3 Tax=Populus TaxID=3689 RepID=A0A4U5MHY1_POPAL|nr:protein MICRORCHIDIA 6-like isoform X4 [Populus alba]XP_034909144.1 protein MICRORCHIDIA 6-like isoform X4 [Populus alba]KAJ6977591.1 protein MICRORCHIDIA 6-like isoform X4 [Populus alba x Populus x berolinensis]TKR68924.1 MORC family CW-type zinc finger protein 3-like isoform X3 [Populus alba]
MVGLEKVDLKAIKLEKGYVGEGVQEENRRKAQQAEVRKSGTQSKRQESEETRSLNALSTGQSNSIVLEQGQPPVDDSGISFASTICPAPLCRQFWKAGNYDDGLNSETTLQNGKSYLHVHPMFLHSNATSHKWAFGAIAELIDNAVDEIQNGATFVIVDKTLNPRDQSPALVIQDNGGGMDPEAIRRCMSFGFSDKKSKAAIGQYGNGFKTSTMRLGADVIVFSCHLGDRVMTQSIGLLSYTFLTQTGHDRIVVPMVDYELNTSTGNMEISHRYDKEYFMSNLSMLLRWSPYSTEAELLKQFDDIGSHGTKVIIYNLWFSDDGNVELDFDTDPEDIRIGGDVKKVQANPAWRTVNEQHIANRLHYSLRAYLSILYLKIPETFTIVLRGQLVEHRNLVLDLKFQEFIVYRPQTGGCKEAEVLTTIGFLKEAPHVTAHGFNIYHKNRLILPFWPVVSYADSRGRGVVGVLEANFVEPTHNKQDFERTSLFQKLEGRLKEMTWEYWDYHCGLIGYQVKKKLPPIEPPQDSPPGMPNSSKMKHVALNLGMPNGGKTKPVTLNQNHHSVSVKAASAAGLSSKRKEHGDLNKVERMKRRAGTRADAHNLEIQSSSTANQLMDKETMNLIQENKKLHAKCLEHEKRREDLDLKVRQLRRELGDVQQEYDRLMVELTSLDTVKEEEHGRT